MRKQVFLSLAAMMALAFVSCQKEETSDAISFTATAEATQSKVIYNENGMFWNSIENVVIYPLGLIFDGVILSVYDMPQASYNPDATAPFAQSTGLTFRCSEPEDLGALTSSQGPFLACAKSYISAVPETGNTFRVTASDPETETANFSDGTSSMGVMLPMVAYLSTNSSTPAGSSNLMFKHLCGIVHVNVTLPEGYNLADYMNFQIYDPNDNQPLSGAAYDITFANDGSITTMTRVPVSENGYESQYTYAGVFNLNDISIPVTPGTYTGLTFNLRQDWQHGFEKTMKSDAQLVVDRAGITNVNITFTTADLY